MDTNPLTRSILVVAKDEETSIRLQSLLTEMHEVEKAKTKKECFEKFKKKKCDFIFIDLDILNEGIDPSISAYQKELSFFWKEFPLAQIVVLCQEKAVRQAVKALQAGVNNYLTYPILAEELKVVTEAAAESMLIEAELEYLRDNFWKDDSLDLVKTKSPVMKKVFDKIKAVAPTKSTVLLTGETGVGKGVVAKLIHRHSDRYENPFVSVHCGAIPETLLESELFGHEKGAFTGAVQKKLGYFEMAHGGTIFLDEIATISHSTQVKLLQVLQDKIFKRVGGQTQLEANLRIISASNEDLKALSDQKEFRSDLYYRLNIFPIKIPPLRERREDIPLLTEHILENLNRINQKNISKIHPDVLNIFSQYAWPGNIRELENLMERAHVLEASSILTPESFPSDIFPTDQPVAEIAIPMDESIASMRERVVDQAERQYLKALLTSQKGRIDQSANIAGVSTRQLHKLLSKYAIQKEDFKN